MPLKLNVGLAKKVGLPDYGSLGATCHVEVELDAALLRDDLDGFHRHVRHAYIACRQAVEDELARNQAARNEQPAASGTATRDAAGGTNGNGTGNHHVSAKQLNYIHRLAEQIDGLGPRRLDALAVKLHGKPPAELTSFEASSLIDTLKAIGQGRLPLDAALKGAA